MEPESRSADPLQRPEGAQVTSSRPPSALRETRQRGRDSERQRLASTHEQGREFKTLLSPSVMVKVSSWTDTTLRCGRGFLRWHGLGRLPANTHMDIDRPTPSHTHKRCVGGYNRSGIRRTISGRLGFLTAIRFAGAPPWKWGLGKPLFSRGADGGYTRGTLLVPILRMKRPMASAWGVCW